MAKIPARRKAEAPDSTLAEVAAVVLVVVEPAKSSAGLALETPGLEVEVERWDGFAGLAQQLLGG